MGLRFPQDMPKKNPPSRPLGYTRVSTYGQTLTAQLEQLRAAGGTQIYREKLTGTHPDRRELLKLLRALGPGDVVTVTRIDRFARSTFDLFAIVRQIADAMAQFRSLAEPWAETSTSTGRLMIAVPGRQIPRRPFHARCRVQPVRRHRTRQKRPRRSHRRCDGSGSCFSGTSETWRSRTKSKDAFASVPPVLLFVFLHERRSLLQPRSVGFARHLGIGA